MDLPEIKGQHRKFRTLVTSYIGNVFRISPNTLNNLIEEFFNQLFFLMNLVFIKNFFARFFLFSFHPLFNLFFYYSIFYYYSQLFLHDKIPKKKNEKKIILSRKSNKNWLIHFIRKKKFCKAKFIMKSAWRKAISWQFVDYSIILLSTSNFIVFIHQIS